MPFAPRPPKVRYQSEDFKSGHGCAIIRLYRWRGSWRTWGMLGKQSPTSKTTLYRFWSCQQPIRKLNGPVVQVNRAANSDWLKTGYDQLVNHCRGGADYAMRSDICSRRGRRPHLAGGLVWPGFAAVARPHPKPRNHLEHLSLFRFMIDDTSETKRLHDGWWTVHWPAIPLAFLESTGMRPWMSDNTSFPPLRRHCKPDGIRLHPPSCSDAPHTLVTGGSTGINSIRCARCLLRPHCLVTFCRIYRAGGKSDRRSSGGPTSVRTVAL